MFPRQHLLVFLILVLICCSEQRTSDYNCDHNNQVINTDQKCATGWFYVAGAGCLDYWAQSRHSWSTCVAQCAVFGGYLSAPESHTEADLIWNYMTNDDRIGPNSFWQGWKGEKNSCGSRDCSYTWKDARSDTLTLNTDGIKSVYDNWVPGHAYWRDDSESVKCVHGFPDGGDKVMDDDRCSNDKYCACQRAVRCMYCGSGTEKSSRTGTCAPCAAGKASNDNSRCQDCLAGKASSSGASTCSVCSAGKFSSANLAEACTNCPNGKYQDLSPASGNTACKTTCTGDSYTCNANGGGTNSGAVSCCSCPDGREQDSSNSGQCKCKVGHRPDSGGYKITGTTDATKTCSECPAGTKSVVSGNSVSCVDCANDEFSPRGSSVCWKCRQNSQKKSVSDGDACVCKPGYSPSGNLPFDPKHPICEPCSVGKFKQSAGNHDCDVCGAHTYSDKFASVACTGCPPGTDKAAATDLACSACEAGKYRSSTETECTNCNSNTFNPLQGSNSDSDCKSCGLHRKSPPGSDSATDCVCNAGYTGEDGSGQCQECKAGSYKTATGDAECTECSAGKFSTSTAAASAGVCTLCPGNSYSEQRGSSDSTHCQCNVGYHGRNGQSCTGCDKGKYKPQRGASGSSNTENDCISCHPGKYQDTEGQSTCIDCEKGTYSFYEERDSLCKTCPENSATRAAGSQLSHCTCNAGYYKKNGQDCVSCEAGKYKDVEGDWSCTSCDPGTFSEQPARTETGPCEECVTGTYSKNGFSSCQNCTAEPGKYCPIGHHDPEGEDCPENHKCAGGHSASEPCPGGAPAIQGQSACTDCVPGKFQSDNVCDLCPSGKTSFYRTQQQSECFKAELDTKTCPPGFYKASETSQECIPCSYLGHFDEYKKSWEKSVRYEFDDTEHKDYSEEWGKIKTESEEYPSHRFNGTMDVHQHCGVFTDAVYCPRGMVYHKSSVPPCKHYEQEPRETCPRGTFYDVGDYHCSPCPNHTFTLFEDSVGVESCSYCREGWFLKESNDTHPQCVQCQDCMTTVAYGGVHAHRMQSCVVPCGPKQMHPDVSGQFNCDIFECLTRVRAQDIHECVFPSLGTELAARIDDEAKCHPYFRPIRQSWVDSPNGTRLQNKMTSGGLIPDKADPRRYSLPFDQGEVDASFLSQNENRIVATRNQTSNPYVDFFYLLFATNTITDKYTEADAQAEIHAWPQILSEKPLLSGNSLQNSSTYVIDQYLRHEPLLFVKSTETLEQDTSGGSMAGWVLLGNYTGAWPHVDFIRLAFERYLRGYVDTAMNRCSDVPVAGDARIYYCHERLHTTTTHIKSEWQVKVQSGGACLDSLEFRVTGQQCDAVYSQGDMQELVVKEAVQKYRAHGTTTPFFLNLTVFREYGPVDDAGEPKNEMCVGTVDEIRAKVLQELSIDRQTFDCSEAFAQRWYFDLMCLDGDFFYIQKLHRDNPQDYFLKLLEDSGDLTMSPEQIERDRRFSANLCDANMSAIEEFRRIISIEHEDGVLSQHNEDVRDEIANVTQGYPVCNISLTEDSKVYPCHVQRISGDDFEISIPSYIFSERAATESGLQARLSVCDLEMKCVREKPVTIFESNEEIFRVGSPLSIDFVRRYLDHGDFLSTKVLTHNSLS